MLVPLLLGLGCLSLLPLPARTLLAGDFGLWSLNPDDN